MLCAAKVTIVLQHMSEGAAMRSKEIVDEQLFDGVESCAAESFETALVGAALPGDLKWDGRVLAADGNIYGIPFNATQVLCFDPRTQQATLVGEQLPGSGKWFGGVLAADGNIYGIPWSATQVLRFTIPPPDTGASAAPDDYVSGGVSDAPSGIDRLGYTIYAKAIAAMAREVESSSASGSLCVGIYAGCGGGKNFLLMLIQRRLAALALVETLEKLHQQAMDKRDLGWAASASTAFEKALARLQDPTARESAMVDQDRKKIFKAMHREQLKERSKGVQQKKDTADCLKSFVERLFLITERFYMCTLGSGYDPVRSNEPNSFVDFSVYLSLNDSFMSQLEQRRQQRREAKAAENHAVAIVLLVVLVLLLVLGLVLMPVLVLVQPFVLPLRLPWLPWLLLSIFLLCTLLLFFMLCCPCSKSVSPADDERKKRVIALLLEGGKIGLSEMNDSQVSLAATLRYVVLRLVQSAVYCLKSSMSLLSRLSAYLLCTDSNEVLPEGATKYVMVEFNAWVYSGVRCLPCSYPPKTFLTS